MFCVALAVIIGAVVGFEWPFKVVESLSKGKYVVAKRDILPGELLLEEKEPLLYITEESVKQRALFMPFSNALFSASCAAFQKLPALQKGQVENLYAPMDRPITAALCRMARNVKYFIPGEENFHAPSEVDVDIFVKVSTLMRFNSFSSEGGHYLFNEMSRFSHSCAANCVYHIVGSVCTCYAVTAIKAGEELTITYQESRDFEPTHQRRAKYAAGKEFTCHCPRCDAPGDDTRQFDCVDPACDGVMMVCQPINNKPIPGDTYNYEGVEYVEPHLLPCTVCHRAAPADYQTKVLAMEEKFPSLTELVINKLFRCVEDKSTPVESWEALLREIDRYQLPRRHLMVQSIREAKLTILDAVHYYRGAEVMQKKRRAALECIDAVHNVFPHPRLKLVELIRNVCKMCGTKSRQPVLSLEEEKALLQKALHMHLIMNGRENRLTDVDSALGKVLSQLPEPPAQSMDVCAFCEESPQCAAMKRSRCGRCKQVAYCSVGCQKAHWKLHTKTCKQNAADK